MNTTNSVQEQNNYVRARESFSGRLLTDTQFDDFVDLAKMMHREIKRSGAFKEKLVDLSHGIARTERMDAMRAGTVIRDVFKELYGQTMNQMREQLKVNNEKLTTTQKIGAARYARAIEPMIRDGNKMSFRRAFSHQAGEMASNLNIAEVEAQKYMVHALRAQDKKDLFEWGKKLDDQYFRPQIEAEKQRQNQSRQQNLTLSR